MHPTIQKSSTLMRVAFLSPGSGLLSCCTYWYFRAFSLWDVHETPGDNSDTFTSFATAYSWDVNPKMVSQPSDRNPPENMEVEDMLDMLLHKLPRATTLGLPVAVSDENTYYYLNTTR